MKQSGMEEITAASAFGSVSCSCAIHQLSIELIPHADSDLTIDLANTSINSTAKEKFYLSSNTMWGTDKWDRSQEFYYDPNSTIVASATRWGGVHDGNLVYQGIKSKDVFYNLATLSTPADSDAKTLPTEPAESYAASVAHEMIRQICDTAFAANLGSGFPWEGLLKWGQQLTPQQVTTAVGLVLAALIARGYEVTFTTTINADGSKTTSFRFGPKSLLPGAPGSVPEKVKTDWNTAVGAAGQYNPKNMGVFPNTKNLSNDNDFDTEALGAVVQVP